MTTASGGVAVIATQLAQTDRRALSEAWYSALHLARDAAPARTHQPARVKPAPASHARRAAGPAPCPERRAAVPSATRTPHEPAAAIGAAGERRRARSETTRRIERAVALLAARPHAPAAHTVDVDGGRVRLLVRSDGRTTRVVALCSRPLRDAVERALASARYALAGTGRAVGAP